jgi:hypothetical protein
MTTWPTLTEHVCLRLVKGDGKYARRYCLRPAGPDGRCWYHRRQERAELQRVAERRAGRATP